MGERGNEEEPGFSSGAARRLEAGEELAEVGERTGSWLWVSLGLHSQGWAGAEAAAGRLQSAQPTTPPVLSVAELPSPEPVWG